MILGTRNVGKPLIFCFLEWTRQEGQEEEGEEEEEKEEKEEEDSDFDI